MKKLNDKGFMLTEVLIVSTLVSTVLLTMYVQFKSIKRNFERGFRYNSVNDVYNLYNVKKYIENEKYINMAGRLDVDYAVSLGDCNSSYYESPNYCKRLYNSMGIKKLYLVHSNLEKIKNDNKLSKDTIEYINTIKSTSGYGYRLIAEFDNNRFASLKVFSGSNYKAAIANSCNTAKKLDYKIYHKLESTNQDIIPPTEKKGGCGEKISLNNEIINDKCYRPVEYSSNELLISTDVDNNKGTIKYAKNTMTLTIKYSGTTELRNDRVVELSCGDKIAVGDYLEAFSGYEFSYASIGSTHLEEYTASVEDKTLVLNYEEVE